MHTYFAPPVPHPPVVWRHAAYAMARACVMRASAPRPLGPDQEAERRESAGYRMTQKQRWAVGQTAVKPRISSSTASQRHLTKTHTGKRQKNAHQRIVSRRFFPSCSFLLVVLGKAASSGRAAQVDWRFSDPGHGDIVKLDFDVRCRKMYACFLSDIYTLLTWS